MTDLAGRYLRRIGVDPAWADDPDRLVAAHAEAIPFEDLDPVAGLGVRTDIDAVVAKLLDSARGGYCHEHARLAQHALAALGYECLPVLARVCRDQTLRAPMAPTHHLTLVLHLGAWRIFDPGFGGGTPTLTVPLDGEVVAAPDADLRVVAAGSALEPSLLADSELLLQRDYRDGLGWRNAYGFAVRRAPEADVEMANWFTATHPDVMFTTTLIAVRHLRDGTRLTLRGNLFRRLTPRGVEDRLITDRASFREVLRDHLHIDAPPGVMDAAWRVANPGG